MRRSRNSSIKEALGLVVVDSVRFEHYVPRQQYTQVYYLRLFSLPDPTLKVQYSTVYLSVCPRLRIITTLFIA